MGLVPAGGLVGLGGPGGRPILCEALRSGGNTTFCNWLLDASITLIAPRVAVIQIIVARSFLLVVRKIEIPPFVILSVCDSVCLIFIWPRSDHYSDWFTFISPSLCGLVKNGRMRLWFLELPPFLFKTRVESKFWSWSFVEIFVKILANQRRHWSSNFVKIWKLMFEAGVWSRFLNVDVKFVEWVYPNALVKSLMLVYLQGYIIYKNSESSFFHHA